MTGTFGLQRASQISSQRIAHVAEILDMQRAIQAHVFAYFFQKFGRTSFIAQEYFGRIARGEVQHQEHCHRDQEDGGYGLQ